MYKYEFGPDYDGITQWAEVGSLGTSWYTKPTKGSFLNNSSYKIMQNTPTSLKDVIQLMGNAAKDGSDLDVATKDKDTLDAILLPPSELYSDILPPEAVSMAKNIEDMVTKQFIQQFYETYMAPIALKDVYNRLGTVAGNIANLHSLYPNGVNGLISASTSAVWRTGLNFAFTVDEGIKNAYGQKISPTLYTSFGFPPFISHDVVNANNLLSSKKNPETENDFIQDTAFDMQNVLYKRNEATYRFPAFKQVNDNINLLQTLLSRCFGIVSTYINEWDLSLYMQEGLCSFKEGTDADGNIVRQPQFVTTLTYGLLDDAPVKPLYTKSSSESLASVDIDQVSTFATLNLAVSTRYGIDNYPIGQQANTTMYLLNKYPYSNYWTPWDSGSLDNSWNVANYVDKFFSYRQNGLPYNEKAPTAHYYTPALYYGGDLSKSTKTFRNVLNYNDDRYAILAGWNSTDPQGNKFLSDGDRTNGSLNSNAFSYTPFWKQFYTSEEDGMTDLDLYFQEVIATGKECSFLNAAYHIIQITCGDNEPFHEVIDDVQATVGDVDLPEGADAQQIKAAVPANYGDDGSYSDMSFSLFKCKLKIPGSKLLSMFLNKSKQTSKAMAAADKAGSFGSPDDPAGTSVSPSGAVMQSMTPSKALPGKKTVIDENGQPVEVTNYVPEENNDLASKKVVGDGVAEWSPFIFGGPHGAYPSPLTLEGYTYPNNQLLANVPTLDSYTEFTGDKIWGSMAANNVRGLEFSKNFKSTGSYIDTVVALTPNERNALTTGSASFGVKNMQPNQYVWMSYYSNTYKRNYYTEWGKYWYCHSYHRWYSNWYYYKHHHFLNGSSRYRYSSRDYGTGSYNEVRYTQRLEKNVSTQADWWDHDFKLLPMCGWATGFNPNESWTYAQTMEHIRHDQARFRQPSTYNISWDDKGKGTVKWVWRAPTTHITAKCVKWMVVPNEIGGGPDCGALDSSKYSDTRWLHWSTYSGFGTTWFNQLKNLWNAGTREMPVTLPIKDNNGRILELICGIADIVKAKSMQWGWELIYYERRKYRHSWCCCPHPYTVRYWYWTFRPQFVDTYNLFFRPERVMWALPTKTLIDNESRIANKRDKSTSDIVRRWSVDDVNGGAGSRFLHVGDGSASSPKLFPFTEDFIQKYGRYEPYTIFPGVTPYYHTRYMGNLRVLHTKGFYYGNIMESYRKEKKVMSVTAVAPYIQTFRSTVSYTESCAGTKIGNYIFGLYTDRCASKESTYTTTRELLWTAASPIWLVSQKTVQPELTALLDSCQSWNSVQQYQIQNKTAKEAYMNWYNPLDTFDVFIETAMQQIAWLEQLKAYAGLYLRDKLIWELYTKSVDNLSQTVVEANYNGDTKNGANYIKACGGWTYSFTEDIYYHDALAIARRVFKTTNETKNTIYDLTVKRITHLKSMLSTAQAYRQEFLSSPTAAMNKFMRLITNAGLYLDNTYVNGQPFENRIFDSAGTYQDVEPYTSTAEAQSAKLTYNLCTDPGAVLWAYINILYHVRKYWINVRLNKRVGSYWTLRSLERVMTFMLAEAQGEDKPNAQERSIPQGVEPELKARGITYVQPRQSLSEQIDKLGEYSSTYTRAVYTPVNYLSNPVPEMSSKWDAELQQYNGNDVVYVNETYKWAYKPKDDLYYVTSNTITSTIQGILNGMRDKVTAIQTDSYKLTETDITDVKRLWTDKTTKDLISEVFEPDVKLSIINGSLKTKRAQLNITQVAIENMYKTFKSILSEYILSNSLESARSHLYPVYIRWNPSHVWSGRWEGDETGKWYIDDYQKEDSDGKERTREDVYGIKHVKTDAIEAGITFDVVTGLNSDTLLSNPSKLRDSSLLEVLCSCVDKSDFWRIEIPPQIDIPVNILEDKPRLIPAYQIDASLNPLKTKTVEPSQASVLAGVASTSVLPILETTADMLTTNSLAALGQISEISVPIPDINSQQ